MKEERKDLEKRRSSAAGEVERTHNRPTYMPSVDIYEDRESLGLRADMPGVDERSVDITIEDGILTIRGAVEEPTSDDRELLYREFHTGDYERSFRLTEDIDVDKVEADVKDGVLTVTLPKSEKARPKKIAVKAG